MLAPMVLCRLVSHQAGLWSAVAVMYLAVLAPAALSQAPPPVREAPLIRVDVELVQIPTRVSTPAGVSILNLKTRDFRIYEDGVEQEVGVLLPAGHAVHVALVVDTSGSTAEYLGFLKKAAREFVEHFGQEDQLGLYEVGPQVVRLVPFTHDHKIIKNGIEELSSALTHRSTTDLKGAEILAYGGSTLLHDGLVRVQADFPQAAQRRAILLFTDGWDQGSLLYFRQVRSATLQGNVTLYVVLPKEDYDFRWLLKQLALAAGLPHSKKNLARALPGSGLLPSSMARRWVIVADISRVAPESIPRFQETAQAFLEELQPEDIVWLFSYRDGIRPLAPPDEHGVVRAQPVSPDEARQLLARLDSTDGAAVYFPQDPIGADRVLILSDEGNSGLEQLHEQMKWNPLSAIVFHPEALADARTRELTIRTAVHDPLGGLELSYESLAKFVILPITHLKKLAADTGGNSFQARKPRELRDIYARVAQEIRSSYTLGYYTRANTGQHLLDVQVRGREAVVQARRVVVVQ